MPLGGGLRVRKRERVLWGCSRRMKVGVVCKDCVDFESFIE